MKIQFLLVSFFMANFAFAWNTSPCGNSYYWDSYGRGLKSAFLEGANTRAQVNDEGCYQLGINAGKNLLSSQNGEGCKRSFGEGQRIGIVYGSMNNAADSCYASGYTAGLADLNISAREGDTSIAGSKCVSAYRDGRRAYQQNLSNDPSSYESVKSRYCYGMGWYNAPLFN